MKKLIFAIITLFVFSQAANAEQWALTVDLDQVSTSRSGVTSVKGTTEAGAAISVKDSNGTKLNCNKLFGLVQFNEGFGCSGKDVVPPLTVTADKSLFSIFSSKEAATIQVTDIHAGNNPWALTVDSAANFFIFKDYRGTSEEGARISAVDAEEKALICFASFFGVSEEGTFNCFGFGVVEPVTFTAKSGFLDFFSDRTETSVVFSTPAAVE